MIIETYRDIEITYRETENVWNFTVNGKERNRESLMKARESIDNALDKEVVEKPWQPFDAYLYRYNEFILVKVTSEADSLYSSSRQFWVKNGSKRSKESELYLYAVNSENDKLLAELRRLDKQINDLEMQRGKMSMAKIKVDEYNKQC